MAPPALDPPAVPEPREFLRFQRPWQPPLSAVAPYFQAAEEAAWYSNGGACQHEFERRTAAYLGPTIHAVPVANCTLGLMAVLRTVTRSCRREQRLVVTPSYTFAAAASAILWSGFLPLFVDVSPETWQLDAVQLGEALDAHAGAVAAVLGTSTFGCPAPHDVRCEWRRVCDHHGVPLIFDSAAGFGASDDTGAMIGGGGTAEIFSFHATKPFAIGEGGLITTTDEALAERLRRVINFDFDANRFVRSRFGFNAKLDELHAAVGLAVLDRYDQILASRRAAAALIVGQLSNFGFNFQAGCATGTWPNVPAQAPSGIDRDDVVRIGAAEQVEIRSYYDVPLHHQPSFRGLPTHGPLTNTERLARGALSLPMHNMLSDRDIERIVHVAAESVRGAGATQGRRKIHASW